MVELFLTPPAQRILVELFTTILSLFPEHKFRDQA